MTNVAHTLADRLRLFVHPANETPESRRGFTSATDIDAWRRHAEDNELLRQIDNLLKGMDAAGTNVDMFMSALPRWYAGVNFATDPWGQATQTGKTRAPCNNSDVDLLDALGLVISTGGGVTLTEDDRRSLADVLKEARDLVENDTSDMPPHVRHYLWSLIVRAEMVVKDFEHFGPDAVRQVAFELGGAMTAQAERAEGRQEPARAGRWRAAATQLMVGFMGGAGSTASGALGEAASEAIKQIGG